MTRKPATQTYAVDVDKYGEARYEATSAQAARSAAWKAFRNVSEGLPFAAFVKMSTVRKIAVERAA